MDNIKLIEKINQLETKVKEVDNLKYQIESLKEYVSQLLKIVPKMEIGEYDSEINWDETDTLEGFDDYTWGYVYKYHIDFNEKFGSIPKVFLSIKAFRVEYELDIWIEARKITQHGFNLHIRSSWDLDDYDDWALAVDWFAIGK